MPMQSPSSAVNPRVLSTLCRSSGAQARAAAQVRDDHAPAAISGATCGRTEAMYSYDSP